MEITFFSVRDADFPIKFVGDCNFFNSFSIFFSEEKQSFKNPQIILMTL